MAIKADESEADITWCLIHPIDYVVHFGILDIDFPGIGYHPDLLLNILDGHPIYAVLAARSVLHLDVFLDDD